MKIRGKYSGTLRQVDILIEAVQAGDPIKIAVECKCYNTKVNVKGVESFIGMMEDLQVPTGVMITNEGYSASAKNRAQGTHQGRLHLDVLSFTEFQEYDFDDWWVECSICDPGPDRPPALVASRTMGTYTHSVPVVLNLEPAIGAALFILGA